MLEPEHSTDSPLLPPPPHDEMETLDLDDSSPSFTAAAAATAAAPPVSDPLLSPAPFPISPTNSRSSLLDPPSYADVVFTPYNHHPNGTISDAGASSAAALSAAVSFSPRSGRAANSDYLRISVSEPATESEPASTSLVPGSGGSYVTYLITSQTSDAECRVRRRFRDFVTLADRLAESYRGFFIPARPDKSTFESQVMQRGEFLEQRRAALERYLWRLAEHPVIGRSDELRVFLQAQGRLPLPTSTDVASRMLDGAVKLPWQLFSSDGALASSYIATPQEVVQPAKGGRDLLRIFKELKQSVTTDLGAVKPPVVEEDKDFLEKKGTMIDLEEQLSSVSKQAEELVKAQQDMGETMGELGLAFVKLTKLEDEEATHISQSVRAAETKRVATAAVKASRFYRELNTQTVRHLETLHEHLGKMFSVKAAFADRASALLTLQTLMSDLSSLHLKVEKLEVAASKVFGGDRSRLRKVEELKETIRTTEDAKSCALREYERIKEHNRSELERLDQERQEDFSGMLRGFVISQVAYWEKIGSVWATVTGETDGYAVAAKAEIEAE